MMARTAGRGYVLGQGRAACGRDLLAQTWPPRQSHRAAQGPRLHRRAHQCDGQPRRGQRWLASQPRHGRRRSEGDSGGCGPRRAVQARGLPTNYVYALSVLSETGVVPFLDNPASSDSRYLGVAVRIVPVYFNP